MVPPLLQYNSQTTETFMINHLRPSGHYMYGQFNHLTPNGHYMGRTAHLTSRCCIFYIYSTNIRTEYFKHAT